MTGGTRPRTGWAWVLIAVCVALFAWRAYASKATGAAAAGGGAIDLQARLMLAARQMGAPQSSAEIEAQLDQLGGRRVSQQMRVAVLAAALVGPRAAAERLDRIEPQAAVDDDERAALALLIRLLPSDPLADDLWRQRADALTEAELTLLHAEVGWLGKVAAAPEGIADEARRASLVADVAGTTTGLVVCMGAAAVVLLLSLVSVIVVLVLFLSGRTGFGAEFEPDARVAAVLLQTFAVWLAIMAVPHVIGLTVAEPSRWVSMGAALASFVALSWPRVHGIGWADARRALGWHRGRGLAVESGCGVLAYLAGLPIVAVGCGTTVGLMAVARGLGLEADAAHPMAAGLGGAGLARFALVLAMAGIVAPIVEETFFRGALYPAVRAASARAGRTLSVLVSAAVTSLLFAAIHPQSWIAIPVLASLGAVFALAREWRGSLIAPMVVHGVSNTLMLTGAWLLLQ